MLQGAGIDQTIIEGHLTVSGGQAGLYFLNVHGPGTAANTCGVTVGNGNSIHALSMRAINFHQGFCLDPGIILSVPWPVVDRATFQSNAYGVAVYSGQASVTNSYFVYQNRSGVWGFDAATVTAVNNTFMGNTYGGNEADRDAAVSLGSGGASLVRNNTITNNLFGLQCDSCVADMDHNNVWGNTTNYAGDASSHFSDLSLDPLYVSIASGNLRLQDVSPLIDAGSSDGASDHDWDGLPRPSGAAWDIGADEWRASRAGDSDNAEKEMLQFVWALPYSPDAWQETPLDARALAVRTRPTRRGQLPAAVEHLTVGVDVGKYLAYWAAVAWIPDGRGTVADYGVIEVHSDRLEVAQAIGLALREFRDVANAGWPTPDGERVQPDQVWIDARYKTSAVCAMARDAGQRFRPVFGYGAGQMDNKRYNRPKATGNIVKYVGDGYDLSVYKAERVYLANVDADRWKATVHQRLALPVPEAGALALFDADPREHIKFAKHLTAERQIEEFVAGKGNVVRWEQVSANNHWLDALVYASAAGHFAGVRVGDEPARPKQAPRPRSANAGKRFTTPDGRPFLVTQRKP